MVRTRTLLTLKNKSLWAIGIAIALNLPGFLGASAQVFTQENQMPANMRPGVRYTTGSYQISGWQSELVKGDRNLAHWNWSPMVGYTQSMGSQHTGKGATAAPLNMPKTQSHYVKYNHVATLVPTTLVASRLQRTTTDTNARLASSDVSATLRHRHPAPMAALSYGGDYRNSSSGSVSGSLEHKDVYGVIKRGI